jgi:beta-lactamase regulating signal transducer with metallopeptidase domain
MMTTMTTTALAGAAILAFAAATSLLLGKASASLRHLVWTTALAATLALPVLETSGVRVEVRVPAALTDAAQTPLLGYVADMAPRRQRPARTPATEMDGVRSPTERAASRPSAMTEAPVASAAVGPTVGGAADRAVAAATAKLSSGTAPGEASASGRSSAEAASERLPTEAAAMGVASARVGPAPGGSTTAVQDHPPVAMGRSMDRAVSAGEALAAVWLIGTLVLLAATLFAQLAAHRLTRRGVRPADPTARGRLAVLAYESRIRRPVRLVVSSALRVPATWGLGTSTIVLPARYGSWSARTLDRVLLHELAHIQRKDCWTLLLGEIARAVYWPNPLTWIAVRRQRFESERACDDRVLARGDVPSDYAEDLVGIARSLRAGVRAPRAALAMAGTAGVASRIRSILDPDRSRGRVGPLGVLAATVLALAVPFSATGIVPVASAQERSIEVPRPPAPSDAPVVPDAPGLVLASALAGVGAPPSVVVAPPAGLLTPPSIVVASSLVDAPFPPSQVSSVGAAQEHCVFREGERRSTSYNVDDDEYRIRWETDSCRVEIDMEGQVEFAADDSGIARMADGALFEIEERIGRTSRRARFDGERGSIERRYWVDGEEEPWSAEADRWIAGMLPELFRHTTINARARTQRMLAEDGPARVFAEVDRGRSDHVRGNYLELMIELADLGEDDYARIIEVAGGFESDHNATELLLAVVARAGLRPAFQEPMLRAAQAIESDHQKARVLGALLESPLTAAQLDAVVRTARDIDSDHQLAQVLATVARSGGLNAAGRAAFMETLGSIESDHQHVTVLEAFLDQGTLSAEELSQVLAMARGIDSDHQRAQVLQRVARDYPLTGDQVTSYLRAAAEIDSDHQIATTAEVVIRRTEFTEEHAEMVLAMTERVSSDHQRATILSAVIERRELSPREIDLVLASAADISSDHQLAQVLVLLVTDEALDRDGVLAVVGAARGVGSDHQQATVLMTLADRHEIDGEALGVYHDLAEGMGRHQRDQVLAAIARRPAG